MTPGCPVGCLGLVEGQAQVQQGSPLPGPVAVRGSGESLRGWRSGREMEERGARPMCQRRKTKRDDLWVTGS